MKMPIRDFINTDFGHSVRVTGGKDGKWMSIYNGPVELTSDGIARWSSNGVLDILVDVNDGSATVLYNDEAVEDDEICSLFNTISGQVNKFTYKKYVLNSNRDMKAAVAVELLRLACDISGIYDRRLFEGKF